MVVTCVVVGCTSWCVDSTLSLHHIPKEEKRQLQTQTLGSDQQYRVCRRHFILDLNRFNCYPVCGMMYTKYTLLLIGKSSPCDGSGFPLTPYNRK